MSERIEPVHSCVPRTTLARLHFTAFASRAPPKHACLPTQRFHHSLAPGNRRIEKRSTWLTHASPCPPLTPSHRLEREDAGFSTSCMPKERLLRGYTPGDASIHLTGTISVAAAAAL